MKILLFGGTFDPPHIGHMALLQNAIAAVAPGRVLVIPAGVPPHKRAAATPAALRLAMCECFRPLFSGLEISDMELHRQGKSYTLDTVLALKRQYPNDELYFSLGGDMLLSFQSWHCYRRLLPLVVLVVQSRQENSEALRAAADVLAAEGGRFVWATGGTPRVSSSEIRQALAAGGTAAGLIPPPACGIVEKEGLYRTGGAGLET